MGTTATLTFGSGDNSLVISGIDADGTNSELNFGQLSAVFDPLGTTYNAGDPTYFAATLLRIGTGAQVELSGGNAALTGTATEIRSTFSQSNLDFSLVQTVGPLNDGQGSLIGALWTQTYTITNNTQNAINFSLMRYTDWHMDTGFGANNDGGGRIFDPNGVPVFFESTDTITPGSTNAFIGTVAVGGNPQTSNYFYLADLGSVDQVVTAGTPLPDQIAGDTNGDGIVDQPTFDNRIAILNTFNLAAGASTTYSTYNPFGVIVPLPITTPNVAPTGQGDTGTSTGGNPVTIDIVSNDSDTDGVLDYSSVLIATQPANGTAVSLGNGLLTYTPNVGFSGTDTFTYTIADDDGDRSAPITVSITVQGVDGTGDLILGSDGDDTLVGAAGNDTINGQAGNDSILGGGGNDSLAGGQGNDTIDGQAGNDTLDGQGGDDVLIGGEGNDTFISAGTGAGNDTVDGGDGFNGIVVNGTGNADTIAISAPSGTLTVTNANATIEVGDNIQVVTVNGLFGDDQITIGDLSLVSQTLVVVNGGEGADTISGQGAAIGGVRLLINGDNGNDTIIGTEGADSINGGAGNDAINGRAGNDVITGADGNDILAGGADNDTIFGGAGADFLTGQTGDDSIAGGDGNDTLRGFEGADTLQGQSGDDLLNGMDGDDSILGGVGKDSITGGSGNDTLDGGRNDDQINGNSGNDLIRGDHGNDYINAGTESDTVNAGDGHDTIIATDGLDVLNGGDGNDQINAGGGNDVISGGDGNDTLLGGGGNDVILGGDGEDQINGQGGTDTVAGNQGIDTIADPASEIDETFVLSAALLTALEAVG